MKKLGKLRGRGRLFITEEELDFGDDKTINHLRNELQLVEEATNDLRQATWTFARALDRLNTVNARFGRGPVNMADELFHHCFSQETLNQRYATASARYQTDQDQSTPDREI